MSRALLFWAGVGSSLLLGFNSALRPSETSSQNLANQPSRDSFRSPLTIKASEASNLPHNTDEPDLDRTEALPYPETALPPSLISPRSRNTNKIDGYENPTRSVSTLENLGSSNNIPPSLVDRTIYYRTQTITGCNGKRVNANFRKYPTLNPEAILGVVEAGDSVKLTGQTTIAGDITWYEAVSPQLFPTTEVGAINQLWPNQTGWIASCFIN